MRRIVTLRKPKNVEMANWAIALAFRAVYVPRNEYKDRGTIGDSRNPVRAGADRRTSQGHFRLGRASRGLCLARASQDPRRP